MVLHRHKAETDPVEELDTVHAGDSHVKEDAEEHSKGNKLEDRRQKDGDSKKDGN